MIPLNLYRRWVELGGEIVNGEYVHPIEALKEFSLYMPVTYLEAVLDSGLCHDLTEKGLAS